MTELPLAPPLHIQVYPLLRAAAAEQRVFFSPFGAQLTAGEAIVFWSMFNERHSALGMSAVALVGAAHLEIVSWCKIDRIYISPTRQTFTQNSSVEVGKLQGLFTCPMCHRHRYKRNRNGHRPPNGIPEMLILKLEFENSTFLTVARNSRNELLKSWNFLWLRSALDDNR